MPYQRGGPPVAEFLKLDIGGLENESRDQLRWLERNVKRGDTIAIKIVETAFVNKPRKQNCFDRADNLQRQNKMSGEWTNSSGGRFRRKRKNNMAGFPK